MSDPKSNADMVWAFYDLVNQGKPEEAAATYIAPAYIQHNPQAPDGPEGFIAFFTSFRAQFPDLRVDIKRTISEGDLIAVHSHLTTSPDDRGTAVVDIFRVENGRFVEHWDVLQPVPETTANDNTMF
jgi:predicted SnoaL-like aldol condensation-catalyzing enzyme